MPSSVRPRPFDSFKKFNYFDDGGGGGGGCGD